MDHNQQTAHNFAASAQASPALRGEIVPPGDKSISHRAVMLGMLGIGTTTLSGLLGGEDILSTIACCRTLGADIVQKGHEWHVTGVGIGGLRPPDDVLDFGNAGTSCRLMMGILASHPLQSFLNGDDSLRSRPMTRVTKPLSQIGARFHTTDQRLPMMMLGAHQPIPIEYDLPVASAQVKSAILFAGLNCPGITRVIERTPTRNHTENMLPLFGAEIDIANKGEAHVISLRGHQELQATDLHIPADISSAAFAIVAAAIIPGSEVLIKNVMNNPTRNGLLETLVDMGAKLTLEAGEPLCGENTTDIHIQHSPLQATNVPADRVASMVDEFPVLAVAAAVASGVTRFNNIGELRVKESDRLEQTAHMLRLAGVDVQTGEDWMEITGQKVLKGGGCVVTGGDHRIAMSALILGGICQQGMRITDARAILTSYPNFIAQMQELGLQLAPEEA